MAWLNGVAIDERDMNPFALLRLLRRERGIMGSLMSLGLSPEQAVELLTHMSIAKAQSESGALDRLFDASDRAEGVDVVRYSKGFDKDERSGSRCCARSRLSGFFRERVLTLAVCKVRPLGPKLEDREHPSPLPLLERIYAGMLTRRVRFRSCGRCTRGSSRP